MRRLTSSLLLAIVATAIGSDVGHAVSRKLIKAVRCDLCHRLADQLTSATTDPAAGDERPRRRVETLLDVLEDACDPTTLFGTWIARCGLILAPPPPALRNGAYVQHGYRRRDGFDASSRDARGWRLRQRVRHAGEGLPGPREPVLSRSWTTRDFRNAHWLAPLWLGGPHISGYWRVNAGHRAGSGKRRACAVLAISLADLCERRGGRRARLLAMPFSRRSKGTGVCPSKTAAPVDTATDGASLLASACSLESRLPVCPSRRSQRRSRSHSASRGSVRRAVHPKRARDHFVRACASVSVHVGVWLWPVWAE